MEAVTQEVTNTTKIEQPKPQVPPTEGATPQEPTPEPQKEEEKPIDKSKAHDLFSSLAKKEKAILKRAQDIAAKEKAIADREAQLSSYQAKIDEWERASKEASTKPLEWLKRGGLTYDQITQTVLNGEQPPAHILFEQAQAKIAELEKRLEERDKKTLEEQTEAQKKNYDQQIKDFFANVKQQVGADTARWELINSLGQQDLVIQVIEEGWKLEKNISYDVAADNVEKYLEQQAFERLAQTNKFKAKFATTPPPKTEEAPKSPQTPAPASSLTNQMAASTASAQNTLRSDEERIQAALAAMQRVKKK